MPNIENPNELPAKTYLNSLPEQDRDRVTSFINHMVTRCSAIDGLRMGILAVGSSTKPESLRDHLVGDVDLLVLNSDPKGSDIRYGIGRKMLGFVFQFLKLNGFDRYWDDYYSPELVRSMGHSGLPLHFLLCAKPLDQEILEARKERRHFALLWYDSPNADSRSSGSNFVG